MARRKSRATNQALIASGAVRKYDDYRLIGPRKAAASGFDRRCRRAARTNTHRLRELTRKLFPRRGGGHKIRYAPSGALEISIAH